MMERIGGHLSYLSECPSSAFQSVKIQEVRKYAVPEILPHFGLGP